MISFCQLASNSKRSQKGRKKMVHQCFKVLSIVMLLVLVLSCAIFPSSSAARAIGNTLSPVKEGYDGMSNGLSSKVGEHIRVLKLSDTYPSDPYYGYQPSRRRP